MDAFIGEIRAFGFNFSPLGWLSCNGQRASVQQYPALYSILGGTYGVTDYKTYFTLPDLRCRAVLDSTNSGTYPNLTLGSVSGNASVTLSISQVPAHTHTCITGAAGTMGGTPSPQGYPSLVKGGLTLYDSWTPPTATTTAIFGTNVVTPVGGNPNAGGYASPHENCSPYLTLNFCICNDGYYPPRN